MNNRGFSLVEALIAAVLVGSAAALLYGSLAQVSRGQQLKAQQAVARRLLANRLALLDAVPPGLVQTGESADGASGRMTWSLSARPGPLPSLAEVTVSIEWPMGAEGASTRAGVSATTFRPVPEPSP